MPMLEIQNLEVSYGITKVILGVSFSIPKEEIVALLGGNGSGKSTILNTICGFLKPRAGTIEFEGKRIDGKPTDHIVKMGVVQTPQAREVFSGMTIQENLEMGAVTRRDRRGIKKSIEDIFKLFEFLKVCRSKKAGYLSGGEQQMLTIGRALMANPKMLLMDEPTAGLAPIIVRGITGVIKTLNEKGLAILLVEHNVGMSLDLANTGYVLKDGIIALADKAINLKNNPELVKSYLGG